MPSPARFALSLIVASVAALACAGLAAAQQETPPADAQEDAEARAEVEAPAGEIESRDQEQRGLRPREQDVDLVEDDSDEGAPGEDGDVRNGAAQVDGEPRDCDDFDTQREAQRYFEERGGDETHNIDGLDADGDGRACESLVAPAGGVDAGGGGTAPRPEPGSSSPLPFMLGGGALGLMLGGVSMLVRRRRVGA